MVVAEDTESAKPPALPALPGIMLVTLLPPPCPPFPPMPTMNPLLVSCTPPGKLPLMVRAGVPVLLLLT